MRSLAVSKVIDGILALTVTQAVELQEAMGLSPEAFYNGVICIADNPVSMDQYIIRERPGFAETRKMIQCVKHVREMFWDTNRQLGLKEAKETVCDERPFVATGAEITELRETIAPFGYSIERDT